MKSIVNSTRIYKSTLSHVDNANIKESMLTYNTVSHTAFKLLKVEYLYGLTLPTSLHLYLKNKFHLDDYYVGSAIQEAKGCLKAQKELQTLYVKNNIKRIKNIDKKMAKLDKEINTYYTCRKLVKRMCVKELKFPKKYKFATYAKGTFYYVDKYNNKTRYSIYEFYVKLEHLIKEVKNRKSKILYKRMRLLRKQIALETELPSLCFGSKALMKKQFTVNEDHQQWLRRFRYKRNYRMLISGRCDAKYGNFVFKYKEPDNTNEKDVDSQDAYNINNINESSMVEFKTIYGIISLPCEFPYMQKELEQAIHAKQATAWCIIDKGEYYLLQAVIGLSTKQYYTSKAYGCVGIDINVDHIALSECDSCGNLLHIRTYPYSLIGKTSNQRKTILRDVVKDISDYCVNARKALVMEKLDTEASKTTLAYGNKKRNHLFSSFQYRAISDMIASRCYKDEVSLSLVNPAFTSQIGKMKYMKQKGLSIHNAASYVIARRGMNLKEKLPKHLFNEISETYQKKHHWSQWNYLTRKYKATPTIAFYQM